MRRRFLVWGLAAFAAAILSSIVGVVGYAFDRSPFPPMGGGVLKLIVLPICVVWVAILSLVYFAERMRARSETCDRASKHTETSSHEVAETQEKKI